MPTLVERLTQTVAAEEDDFFLPETKLYYLNKSQNKVVSYGIQKERNSLKTLRALDELRRKTEQSVNGLTFTDEGDYYSVQVTFPSSGGLDLNQFSYLKYGDKTVLRELTQDNLLQLEHGNAQPNAFESYYNVVNDGSNKLFELFVPSDDSATSKTVAVYYVLKPSNLVLTDETLDDLPDQLENAVIYGAATMMVMQESVKDPNNQAKLFQQLYQEELNSSLF